MKLNKTIFTYILLSLTALIFGKVYGLFGHGVTSGWMSNMYLYLLGLGVLAFTLLRILIPGIVSRKGYRLFYNTYNSGVAVLITGILLKGILDIAGSTSHIIPWFFYTAYGLIAAAAIMFFTVLSRKNMQAMRTSPVILGKIKDLR